ncbi:hypothetical protein [Methanomethylophilus alvi]|uniref:hypothetical protein n=1 Tax=Methanomethylophilus alvi TaxID=1291540 RepID=UPI0037DD38BB
MAKPSFLDTLKHYMKGEDLERAKVMLEKTEEEFVTYELERIPVKKTPQILFGCSFVRSRTSRNQGYPVAGLFIVNKSPEPAKYSIRLELDRNITFTAEKTLSGNSSSYEIISCKDDKLSAYVNMPVYAKMSVTDAFDREITSTSGEIIIVSELTKPRIEAVFVPAKTNSTVLGTVSLKSKEKTTFNLLLKVLNDRAVVSVQPLIISPEQSSDKDVVIDSTLSLKQPRLFKPTVSVECDGYEICQTKAEEQGESETRVPNQGQASTSKLKIFAECTAQRLIDFNTQSNGIIVVGAIALTSSENTPQTVSVSLVFEGESLFTTTKELSSRMKTIIEIPVPVKHIARNETYQAEVRFTVLDSSKAVILDRFFVMVVRSRYDLDLSKLKIQTAQFVNPLDPAVEKFIESKDSPLSREMGSEFTVMAYQWEKNIIPQIKAVFNAVKNQGMHYVSSTETFHEGHYQRVRSPGKVLEDHSGNCIELSILYASILEAMGFETAVVFPYGHAIVGVVMGTNAYRTSSKMPDKCRESILKIGNGPERYEILCFEATMCSHKTATFEGAVLSAYNTIREQLSGINSRSDYTIVEKERQRGIKPRVE